MLHAGHFAIYLQGREQQLGSWQLAEPFALRAMVKQAQRGKTVGAVCGSGDRSVSTVLGSHSEALPVEGLQALKIKCGILLESVLLILHWRHHRNFLFTSLFRDLFSLLF